MADANGATLTLTDEQTSFQHTLRAFLEHRSGVDTVRERMLDGSRYDLDSWQRLCTDLSFAGVGVPEDRGGAGGALRDLSLGFEELGRSLALLPALATIGLARTALVAAGDQGAVALLPGLISGERTGTLVAAGCAQVDVTVDSEAGGPRLSGRASLVLDGATADLLLLLADGAQGRSLYAVDAGSDGVTRNPSATLDLTRAFADVTLDRASATLLGEPGRGKDYVHEALRVARVLLAAEALGGAQRCLEDAVRYAKERVQFGREIGSFQAVKHRCADMLVAVELIRAAVLNATAASPEGGYERAVATAAAIASDAYLDVAAANLQLHGGLGFTWEHSAHLYVKRARSMRGYLGDPIGQRREVAELLGI